MRIYGTWGPFEAPYVRTVLNCPLFHVQSPVIFLIDSGASRTTILDSDAARIGIDYSKLKRFEQGTTGIGGIVDTYILPDVTLTFRTPDSLYEERFKEIFVLKHGTQDDKTLERVRKLPSLLGRDVINKYELVLNRREEIVLLSDE